MNRLLVTLFVFATGTGCKEDKFITPGQISGSWQVVKATRNTNPTHTFDGAYFKFSRDSVNTNYQGEILESPFVLQKNVLVQTQPESLLYDLQMPHKDTLILSTDLHGSHFTFTLNRIP